jgi:hypothetical protein
VEELDIDTGVLGAVTCVNSNRHFCFAFPTVENGEEFERGNVGFTGRSYVAENKLRGWRGGSKSDEESDDPWIW